MSDEQTTSEGTEESTGSSNGNPPPGDTGRAAREAGPAPGPEAPEPPISEEDEEWVADRGAAAINSTLLAAAIGVVRRPPARDLVALLRKVGREPSAAKESLADLAEELGRVVAGRSELEPWKLDRRYADDAWQGNPFLRDLAQAHAAGLQALEEFFDRLGLDPGTDYRLRLALTNLAEALSPAHVFVLNPGAVKAAIDTGGASIVKGVRRFVRDMRSPPRLPVRTDATTFELGTQIAATPGSVVHRTPAMELIQYDPVTPTVDGDPLLIVPSVVNKFYLTDLAPGRSLAEYAVQAGRQVFSISWVNPDFRHRDYDHDTYIAAIVEANEAVRTITGSEGVGMLGVCAGGQLATIAAGYLAAIGEGRRVSSLTLLVCVTDHAGEAGLGGMIEPDFADAALDAVRERGYIDGRDLTTALAWLRPVDSVWWPFTHRYLLGADMPKFDLFYWSEDVMNVPAELVADMIDVAMHNRLLQPGSLVVLGEPIDLGKVRADAYVVAGFTDHLTAWEACYRSQLLLGAKRDFVLVDGGHIQSIIRPPGKGRTGFHTAPGRQRDPNRWLKAATGHDGSWWPHWIAWLDERSTGERPAPETPGGGRYAPLDPAPGVYVRRRLDAE